jgi:hypothetical protein
MSESRAEIVYKLFYRDRIDTTRIADWLDIPESKGLEHPCTRRRLEGQEPGNHGAVKTRSGCLANRSARAPVGYRETPFRLSQLRKPA